MMIFDSDDFGCDHVISDMCQSHDCRDILLALKEANPAFKATLFAIPGEMTFELLEWSRKNRDWIQLAMHGFYHASNYECADMTYLKFNKRMDQFLPVMGQYFAKIFKAPGWQIGEHAYRWLDLHGWAIADQDYNDGRRPGELKVYKIGENSVHTHTWNCVGNGVYELFDQLKEQVAAETEFKFIKEVL